MPSPSEVKFSSSKSNKTSWFPVRKHSFPVARSEKFCQCLRLQGDIQLSVNTYFKKTMYTPLKYKRIKPNKFITNSTTK